MLGKIVAANSRLLTPKAARVFIEGESWNPMSDTAIVNVAARGSGRRGRPDFESETKTNTKPATNRTTIVN